MNYEQKILFVNKNYLKVTVHSTFIKRNEVLDLFKQHRIVTNILNELL